MSVFYSFYIFFKKNCFTLNCFSRPSKVVLCPIFVLFLSGCAVHVQRAPVVDRSTFLGETLGTSDSLELSSIPLGMVRVEEGDSLYQIALKIGRNWRDLSKWNNLSDPNYIEKGQLLHTSPPNMPINASETGVLPNHNVKDAIKKDDNFTSIDARKKKSQEYSPFLSKKSPSFSVAGFVWPAKGVVKKFGRGIDILGKEGSDVLAAAEGKVLYAGSGLRAYGNLIVLKHSNHWLTAYGHSKILLVKEGDEVFRGQKIAEMGSTGSNDGNIKLYFEVRKIPDDKEGIDGSNKKGAIVDPLSILPSIQ